MTRIFDALKKAEASRQATPIAPAAMNPLPSAALPHAAQRPPARTMEPWRVALPLLGSLPMTEEVLREIGEA